jgi:hypothetical protein
VGVLDPNLKNWAKTGKVGQVKDLKDEGKIQIYINLFALWKDKSAPNFLYLTIAHELVHVRDVIEGRVDFWNEFYGEDVGNIIAEYHAYERSGLLEKDFKVDYGHDQEYQSLWNQLPRSCITLSGAVSYTA